MSRTTCCPTEHHQALSVSCLSCGEGHHYTCFLSQSGHRSDSCADCRIGISTTMDQGLIQKQADMINGRYEQYDDISADDVCGVIASYHGQCAECEDDVHLCAPPKRTMPERNMMVICSENLVPSEMVLRCWDCEAYDPLFE